MPRIPESGAGLSLSLRLALSLSALILLLGLLALLAIGRMTERLQQAVGESAGAVGRSLVQVLRTSRVPMNEAQTRAEDQAAEVARIQALVLQAQAEGAREEAARANAQAEIHQAIDQAMREAVAAGPGLQREVRVEVNGRELAPQDIAALTDSLAERIDPDAVRFEVLRERGEARLQVIGLGPELRIELPSSPVERTLDEFRRQLLWALGGLLLLGMLGASLIARRLTRPLQALGGRLIKESN